MSDEVETFTGTSGDFYWNMQIPFDDASVYYFLSHHYLDERINFCEMPEIMLKVRPCKFDELMASIALAREGPIARGMTEKYIFSKFHHPQSVLDEIQPFVAKTYGTLIYQEQVMEMAIALAGYMPDDAYVLRNRLVKRIPDEIEEEREKFLTGMEKNGFSRRKSREIFGFIERYGGATFSKSHAVCRALLLYRLAWLSMRFPDEMEEIKENSQ